MQPYKLYDENYVPAPFGMQNYGVSCWLNSIIQLLISLPSFNQSLHEFRTRLTVSPESIKPVQKSNEFLQTFAAFSHKAVQLEASPASQSATRADVDELHAKIFRLITTNVASANAMTATQNCVDEAFTKIVDLLGVNWIQFIFRHVYKISLTCPHCRKETSSVQDSGFRLELFTKFCFSTAQDFADYIFVHQSNCDTYRCDCGNLVNNAPRIEKLQMLREVIVIIFNKYQSKDMRWFPQTLEFADSGGGRLIYGLVAKIEHSGNMHGGHYVCHALRQGSWYYFSDSTIGAGSPQPTENTFMIAYHMLRNTPATVNEHYGQI